MAEEIDRASSDRQATWVALKTLRQRPTVVGRTDDGATVYEARSVRLVLSPGSSHFRRLVACSRCGRDALGSPVLSQGDLDRPSFPVYCDRCAQASGSPKAEVRREEEGPPAAAEPVVQDDPPQKAVVDADRLAVVEAQLTELLARPPSVDDGALHRLSEQVGGVLGEQNAQLGKLAALLGEVRAEISALGESDRVLARAQVDLDQKLVELANQAGARPGAELEGKLAQELAEVRASLVAIVDASAQPLRAALADRLDHVHWEIASLQQRLDHESADRSENQGDLDRRMRELAAQLAVLSGEAVGAPDLADLRADLAATMGAGESRLSELLRGEIASLEQRSRDEFAAVAAELEAQRKNLTETLREVARETLMSVAEPLRDLTRAREESERRLDVLWHRAEQDQRRVEALIASAEAGASRLLALEQRLQTRPPRRAPAAVLDDFERQLREAEERLSGL